MSKLFKSTSITPPYPPIIVDHLPNWPKHFENLKRKLGRPINARPFGSGIMFNSTSEKEYRCVQEIIKQESSLIPPHNDIRVSIRGLHIATGNLQVRKALTACGFLVTDVEDVVYKCRLYFFVEFKRTTGLTSHIYDIKRLLMKNVEIQPDMDLSNYKHETYECHQMLWNKSIQKMKKSQIKNELSDISDSNESTTQQVRGSGLEKTQNESKSKKNETIQIEKTQYQEKKSIKRDSTTEKTLKGGNKSQTIRSAHTDKPISELSQENISTTLELLEIKDFEKSSGFNEGNITLPLETENISDIYDLSDKISNIDNQSKSFTTDTQKGLCSLSKTKLTLGNVTYETAINQANVKIEKIERQTNVDNDDVITKNSVPITSTSSLAIVIRAINYMLRSIHSGKKPETAALETVVKFIDEDFGNI